MGCICPKCKSNNVIPIMYGYPAPEAMEEAEKGNLKLGGYRKRIVLLPKLKA